MKKTILKRGKNGKGIKTKKKLGTGKNRKLATKNTKKLVSTKTIKRNITNIKTVSESRISPNRVYNLLKKYHLLFNPVCEICHIKPAKSIHHSARRLGNNLYRGFFSACAECHNTIELNTVWAKSKGYLVELDPRRPLGDELEFGDALLSDEEFNKLKDRIENNKKPRKIGRLLKSPSKLMRLD